MIKFRVTRYLESYGKGIAQLVIYFDRLNEASHNTYEYFYWGYPRKGWSFSMTDFYKQFETLEGSLIQIYRGFHSWPNVIRHAILTNVSQVMEISPNEWKGSTDVHTNYFCNLPRQAHCLVHDMFQWFTLLSPHILESLCCSPRYPIRQVGAVFYLYPFNTIRVLPVREKTFFLNITRNFFVFNRHFIMIRGDDLSAYTCCIIGIAIYIARVKMIILKFSPTFDILYRFSKLV